MDILTIVVVFIIAGIYAYYKATPLRETIQLLQSQSQIKERDRIFLEQEHIFYMSQSISLTQLMTEIDTTYFKSLEIECHDIGDSDIGDVIQFTIGRKTEGFNLLESYIVWVLYKEGDTFRYVHTQTKNGLDAGFIVQSNFLLTKIEEALKRLDSQVEVQRKVIEYVRK